MNRLKRVMTPKVRRWAYGVTAAAFGVAAWYKIVPPESLAVWLPLALAFFNVKPDPNDEESNDAGTD